MNDERSALMPQEFNVLPRPPQIASFITQPEWEHLKRMVEAIGGSSKWTKRIVGFIGSSLIGAGFSTVISLFALPVSAGAERETLLRWLFAAVLALVGLCLVIGTLIRTKNEKTKEDVLGEMIRLESQMFGQNPGME